ncbi:MAG: hypothetical protein ACI4OR_00190 [Alphaproteobacteria bacterium]
MKKILFIFLICFGFSVKANAEPSDFEKLLPLLTKESTEKEIAPKTTEELRELFQTSSKELPRVFVQKLPFDFAQSGDKELYSKVITALILRENEQILNERILFLLLKDKADKGQAWTSQEQAYFDYLVDKYDAIVLKTVPTKINDLFLKIDEIPPSLAIAQTALDTDFGKQNMASPFGQQGWLDNQTYAPIQYENLSDAVKAYVIEMNATPNYDDWRRIRNKHTHQQTPKGASYMAGGLRTYRPEDTAYIEKIRILMKDNPFIFSMDKLNLKKNK